jgi:hypothetical protein
MFRIVLLFMSCLSVIWINGQSVPINRVRVLASHNSYKCLPEKGVIRFLHRLQFLLPDGLNPDEMDYGHIPIEEQLDSFNIRGLELDVYADPAGGLFSKRRLPFFIWGPKQNSERHELTLPGIKILHIKDVDYQSNVNTWVEAMQRLSKWSDSHVGHSVVFVNVEIKNESPGGSSRWLRYLGFRPAEPFDKKALIELTNVAIKEMGEHLYTPKEMMGDYFNLKERVVQKGWPTMEDTKGKFIFILEGLAEDLKSEVLSNELDYPFFYYGNEENPNVVFVLKNNCKGNEAEIQECVQSGLMVRTRADAGTYESRKNDWNTYYSAVKSGAQIISTDYYLPDRRWSEYCVPSLISND